MIVKKVVFIFCLLITANLYAQGNPDDSLSTLLNNYRTLQAQFTAKTLTSNGEVVSSTGGDMAFQRPDLFRWYSLSPSKQLIINNSQKLAIYDVALAQVTYKNVDEQDNAIPALLLSGDVSKLKQHYNINACAKDSANCYQLSAKDDNAVLKRLTITFNNNVLKNMIIDNNLDQTTEIRFKNVKINSILNPSLFKLNLPAGVDIVQ